MLDSLVAQDSAAKAGDGEYFDVVSEPAGKYVRGILKDNGTAIWFQAGASIGTNESVSVRIRYHRGETIVNNASIVSECGNATRVERVMLGLYSSDPIVSYGPPCNGSAANVSVNFLTNTVEEKLSDERANQTYVMLYILRVSRPIYANDTLEVPVPHFVHTGSGRGKRLMGDGVIESLGAGAVQREPASHYAWRCRATPNMTYTVDDARMMLVVKSDIPAGDAIIFKISYLFKVRPPVVNFVDPGPNVTQCRPYMFNQTDCMHKNILTNRTLDNIRGCPCIPADCFTALCNNTNYTAMVTTNTWIQNCSRTVVNGTMSFMPCNLSLIHILTLPTKRIV